MFTYCKISLLKRAVHYPAIFGVVLLVYYSLQVLPRTQPLTSLQKIAHRGGPKYAPENTLAAFRMSIDEGVDWLEFDVQMTKDGFLVVIHDETVNRTTNGSGRVRDLTLDQIRALDAGQGETIPTFEEVVELAKSHGVKILAEIKSAHLYPGMVEKMLQILEQANYLDQTVFQSFDSESLETLRRLSPRANLCPLYGLGQFSVRAPSGDAEYVCLMAEMVIVNPLMIHQAHMEGRKVFIWFGVIESPFSSRIMCFFGADGLIINDPMIIEEH